MATVSAPTTAAPAPPAAAAAVPSASVPRGQVDLIDFIDWTGVECLNQDPAHGVANALKQGYREDEGLHLASDWDEQLLIYIPFMQVIKLHSALFKGPEEEGPKTVKLFSNREHMGFSNVNDFPPSDTVDLSSSHLLESKPVTLKYVKFQNVRSLTMFIEDNQSGADITQIQKIALYGTTEDEGLHLASDWDEQLLIYTPFMQVIKLHSALFKGPEEEATVSPAPSPSGRHSPVRPLRKQRNIRFQMDDTICLLESLPQDVLVKALCKVNHSDLKQLLLVSKPVSEATVVAQELHFAFATPSEEGPGVPKQHRVARSRYRGKDLASVAVSLSESFSSLLSEV